MTTNQDRNDSNDEDTARDRLDPQEAGRWREEFLSAAGQVLDSDRLASLRDYTDNPGRIADTLVASHLEDERMVQQMHFHRERREAGRALALGDRDAFELHRSKVASAGAELGLLRIQRDVADGTLNVQPDEKPSQRRPDKRGPSAK